MDSTPPLSSESPGQQARAIDSLYRISSLIGHIDSPERALETILDEIIDALGVSSASVALIHPESHFLVVECARGAHHGLQGFELPLGVGVTGWVALNRRPLVVKDTEAEPRYVEARPGVRSEMAVPMEDRGQMIGVLNVDSDTPRAFDESNLKFLILLTREATAVVSQLWMMRQLKTKADQLESLITVGSSIVAERDQGRIFETLAAESRRLTNCPVAAIFLFDPTANRLRLRHLSGPEAFSDYQEDLNPQDSSLGTVLSHLRPVEILDLPKTEEHHFVPLIQQLGLVSMLAVPVALETERIGLLSVYTQHLHRFNNDEKRLLRTLADIGAIAIENTRLYQRIFRSEEKLRENEKLTTLGLLSAEIAHEIRNPLTVIQLLFQSLHLDFPEADMRHRDIAIISEKLHQLEEIVGRVLNFGKTDEAVMSHCLLGELISETLQLIRLKLHQQQISIDYEPHPQSIRVYGHKGQLQQVLLNLFINATEAMPRGGRIRIQESLDEDRQLQLIISDTGSGIPPDLQPHIFESFLSGKRGAGLGLAIVKQILRSHRGDIELAQSSPGGSTFRIRLPTLTETDGLGDRR